MRRIFLTTVYGKMGMARMKLEGRSLTLMGLTSLLLRKAARLRRLVIRNEIKDSRMNFVVASKAPGFLNGFVPHTDSTSHYGAVCCIFTILSVDPEPVFLRDL